MSMHPGEIAKELKAFLFFKSFSEDLLLQLSTLMQIKTFKKDDVLLHEGEENKSLFFLRSGKVEVLLAKEIVTILQTPGEVMGEMSVLNGSPVATTLRVADDGDCFVLDSRVLESFTGPDHDHFKSLLYRIYSVILSERLKKTNEKARLFEINNRELQESQNADRMGVTGNVLMVEPEKKMQVIAKLALGGTGVKLTIVPTIEEAKELLKTLPADVLICEDSNIDFFKEAHANKWATKFILLTTMNVSGSLDNLSQLPFVDNVVSRNASDRTEASKALMTSINKVIQQDLFGMEKYLSWGVEISNVDVVYSGQRDDLKQGMVEHLKGFGIRGTILDRAYTVAEEMMMNAIYDAPVDSYGKSLFNHLSRREEIRLDSHQQSHLRYACDGMTLAISVEDPFGALTKDIIINYLKSCYEGRAGSLNTNKGGAGRGLHLIIESADTTIFNVKRGVRTEVICLFNLDPSRKEAAPSFFYFFI